MQCLCILRMQWANTGEAEAGNGTRNAMVSTSAQQRFCLGLKKTKPEHPQCCILLWPRQGLCTPTHPHAGAPRPWPSLRGRKVPSSPSSPLRNGAEGRARADGDLPPLCPPHPETLWLGSVQHRGQPASTAWTSHVFHSTQKHAQLLFLPAVPTEETHPGSPARPRAGEPFPPLQPLLQLWWEGPLQGLGTAGTMGAHLQQGHLVVPRGEAGRDRTSACPHQGPFVPHVSKGPISGSSTRQPATPASLVRIQPGVGDGAAGHHHAGHPAPAEPGSPCLVPASSKPTPDKNRDLQRQAFLLDFSKRRRSERQLRGEGTKPKPTASTPPLQGTSQPQNLLLVPASEI